MTYRRRLAVLAASSLLLAGCAVPGEGTPGVVVDSDGAQVTSAQLDDVSAAWAAGSEDTVVPGRATLATLAALGPALVEAAAEQGVEIRDGDATTIAEAWFEYAGATAPEVTDDIIESARALLALYVLAYSDPSYAAIRDVADAAQADAVFSPRLGEFSTDALLSSVSNAQLQAENAGLGNYSFAAFVDVSGFTATTAPWAARG